MARFPSGLGNPLPERVDDPRVWMARIAVAAEEHPIGTSAPCLNPECTAPVDYLGTGIAPRYCSNTCRSRTATIRKNAQQQLKVIALHYKNEQDIILPRDSTGIVIGVSMDTVRMNLRAKHRERRCVLVDIDLT